jgi:hypothetical protein
MHILVPKNRGPKTAPIKKMMVFSKMAAMIFIGLLVKGFCMGVKLGL